jgi:malonyl CoA-acyl carrier protein transacylase
MTTTVLVFPGQGSQKMGMGGAWIEASPAAARTFEEADAVLGEPLSQLIREGPEEDLTLTANTQPAILTVSVAMLRALASAGSTWRRWRSPATRSASTRRWSPPAPSTSPPRSPWCAAAAS